MKLFVKNMVCDRCKTAVKNELDNLQMEYTSVELGEIETTAEVSTDEMKRLASALELQGFELIESKNGRLVNAIKKSVIEWVRSERAGRSLKFSAFLADKLSKDYSQLSSLFSAVENTTIEQYLILQKIEFAKELLVYDELSLAEIADKLHYSSPSHLSNQFKKITGLTPIHFKKVGVQKRIALDKV